MGLGRRPRSRTRTEICPIAHRSPRVVLPSRREGAYTGFRTDVQKRTNVREAHMVVGRPAPGAVLHGAATYDLLVWLLTFGRERSFREKILRFARVGTGESVLDV